jgi:hypothetical protein
LSSSKVKWPDETLRRNWPAMTPGKCSAVIFDV